MSARRGDASAFWKWFAAHERGLRTEDRPPEDLLDDVLAKLGRYCEGLGFETYVDEERDDRRFIVTAYGNRDRFQAVEDLVAAAPEDLPWRAIALKPAKGFAFTQERAGRTYDPGRMRFDPLSTDDLRGPLPVRVYLEDYDPDDEDEQWQAVKVILLTALGERTVADDVHLVEVVAADDESRAEALRLDEIPAYVTWWRKKHGLDT